MTQLDAENFEDSFRNAEDELCSEYYRSEDEESEDISFFNSIDSDSDSDVENIDDFINEESKKQNDAIDEIKFPKAYFPYYNLSTYNWHKLFNKSIQGINEKEGCLCKEGHKASFSSIKFSKRTCHRIYSVNSKSDFYIPHNSCSISFPKKSRISLISLGSFVEEESKDPLTYSLTITSSLHLGVIWSVTSSSSPLRVFLYDFIEPINSSREDVGPLESTGLVKVGDELISVNNTMIEDFDLISLSHFLKEINYKPKINTHFVFKQTDTSSSEFKSLRLYKFIDKIKTNSVPTSPSTSYTQSSISSVFSSLTSTVFNFSEQKISNLFQVGERVNIPSINLAQHIAQPSIPLTTLSDFKSNYNYYFSFKDKQRLPKNVLEEWLEWDREYVYFARLNHPYRLSRSLLLPRIKEQEDESLNQFESDNDSEKSIILKNKFFIYISSFLTNFSPDNYLILRSKANLIGVDENDSLILKHLSNYNLRWTFYQGWSVDSLLNIIGEQIWWYEKLYLEFSDFPMFYHRISQNILVNPPRKKISNNYYSRPISTSFFINSKNCKQTYHSLFRFDNNPWVFSSTLSSYGEIIKHKELSFLYPVDISDIYLKLEDFEVQFNKIDEIYLSQYASYAYPSAPKINLSVQKKIKSPLYPKIFKTFKQTPKIFFNRFLLDYYKSHLIPLDHPKVKHLLTQPSESLLFSLLMIIESYRANLYSQKEIILNTNSKSPSLKQFGMIGRHCLTGIEYNLPPIESTYLIAYTLIHLHSIPFISRGENTSNNISLESNTELIIKILEKWITLFDPTSFFQIRKDLINKKHEFEAVDKNKSNLRNTKNRVNISTSEFNFPQKFATPFLSTIIQSSLGTVIQQNIKESLSDIDLTDYIGIVSDLLTLYFILKINPSIIISLDLKLYNKNYNKKIKKRSRNKKEEKCKSFSSNISLDYHEFQLIHLPFYFKSNITESRDDFNNLPILFNNFSSYHLLYSDNNREVNSSIDTNDSENSLYQFLSQYIGLLQWDIVFIFSLQYNFFTCLNLLKEKFYQIIEENEYLIDFNRNFKISPPTIDAEKKNLFNLIALLHNEDGKFNKFHMDNTHYLQSLKSHSLSSFIFDYLNVINNKFFNFNQFFISNGGGISISSDISSTLVSSSTSSTPYLNRPSDLTLNNNKIEAKKIILRGENLIFLLLIAEELSKKNSWICVQLFSTFFLNIISPNMFKNLIFNKKSLVLFNLQSSNLRNIIRKKSKNILNQSELYLYCQEFFLIRKLELYFNYLTNLFSNYPYYNLLVDKVIYIDSNGNENEVKGKKYFLTNEKIEVALYIREFLLHFSSISSLNSTFTHETYCSSYEHDNEVIPSRDSSSYLISVKNFIKEINEENLHKIFYFSYSNKSEIKKDITFYDPYHIIKLFLQHNLYNEIIEVLKYIIFSSISHKESDTKTIPLNSINFKNNSYFLKIKIGEIKVLVHNLIQISSKFFSHYFSSSASNIKDNQFLILNYLELLSILQILLENRASKGRIEDDYHINKFLKSCLIIPLKESIEFSECKKNSDFYNTFLLFLHQNLLKIFDKKFLLVVLNYIPSLTTPLNLKFFRSLRK